MNLFRYSLAVTSLLLILAVAITSVIGLICSDGVHSNYEVYIPKIVMYTEELPCPANATFSCTPIIYSFSPEREDLAEAKDCDA